MRLVVLVLGGAGVLGTLAFTGAAVFGIGDSRSSGFEALYVCLHLLPGAVCLLRAALVPGERAVWGLIGVGMVSWAGGYAYYFLALQSLTPPPYPSFADALWVFYLLACFAAVLLLIRSRLLGVRQVLWIDAVVGSLALAAVAAAVLIVPILESTAGSVVDVTTNLLYPGSDLLIVGAVLGVYALCGWRPGRVWLIIGGAFVIQTGADIFYVHEAAVGDYVSGGLLDVTWPLAALLLALAAWHPVTEARGVQLQGWPALAVSSVFTLVALALMVYDHVQELNDPAFVLAALTLLAVLARSTLTFGDMRTLTRSRELARQNESILNAAGEGIFGVDRRGLVTFVNPAGTRMLGYGADELLGRRKHELIHHTRSDGTPYPVEESPVAAALQEGAVRHADQGEIYWRKDGTSFPVELTITPIVEGRAVSGAVVVFKDVTERRAVERAKDEFTAVVSHELRTPLTSIRGSLGLLESGVLGALPARGQRMVQIAVQNTDRLVRLINDILDIERIDSGQIDMHLQLCDGVELIERAIEGVAQFAVQAGVRVTACGDPVGLVADRDRVLQTLTNLISNAVKFSAAGGVVGVSCARDDGGVLFEVRDQGRGIPADKLGSIFERFAQVDASDSREKGGTGLGLAICRTIVEHHGGRIWVDSELGVGSTFSFVLPAQQADRVAPDAAAPDGTTVLVCDDDPSVLEVVGAMLEQRGYRVIAARCGEQALALALSERPDVILLDLLMAGMSGWETAAALARGPETRQIPIVILSVLSPGESESPDAPVAGWVEKPLDEAALFAALERVVRGREESFKVLIVEDDPDLAAILAATFERHGIRTFHAGDGREAIRLSQQVAPDLLVLDVGLPGTNGFEVVDWLRRHERLSALPMVVYTARELDHSDRERLRLGADTEFLTKGRISPQAFEHHVMRLLARLTAQPETSDEPEAHPAGR